MAKKTIEVIWTAASVTADTDWFAADISSHSQGGPVRHTLQATMLSVGGPINLIMTRGGVTKTVGLGAGLSILGSTMFQESYIIPPGTTYNVQHTTVTNVIGAVIMVDEDDLNIS